MSRRRKSIAVWAVVYIDGSVAVFGNRASAEHECSSNDNSGRIVLLVEHDPASAAVVYQALRPATDFTDEREHLTAILDKAVHLKRKKIKR